MARAKPGGRGNKLAEFRSMTRVNSSGSLVCILTIFLVYRESVFEKKKKKKNFRFQNSSLSAKIYSTNYRRKIFYWKNRFVTDCKFRLNFILFFLFFFFRESQIKKLDLYIYYDILKDIMKFLYKFEILYCFRLLISFTISLFNLRKI